MTKNNVISLDTGTKSVLVENKSGHSHELTFNPNDVLFIERLHGLYRDANTKANELENFQDKIPTPEMDDNGVPLEITSISEKIREINNWFRSEIDKLFGEGTSYAIYGDAILYGEAFSAYTDLISKLLIFIEPVRKEKTKKYVAKKVSKKAGARTKAR